MWTLEHALALPLGLTSIGSRQKKGLGERVCLACLKDRKKVPIAGRGMMNERERVQLRGIEAGAKLYRPCSHSGMLLFYSERQVKPWKDLCKKTN